MAECYNCGAQVAQGAASCPECGARFTNQGQQHQHQHQQGQPQQGAQTPQQGRSQDRVQQAQPQQMADGGDSSAIGALIGVLSIIYSLLNLVLTAGFLLGASIAGAASQA
ncbi:MAG: putative ATP-dependent serine protease, partial [Salinirussus sp.]